MAKTKIPTVASLSPRLDEDTRSTRNVIAWTSLAFAVLQSICTFFAAMNGLRVGIGISSLVLAAGTASAIDRFHVDWLRVPMISLALLGSVLNLLVTLANSAVASKSASKVAPNDAEAKQAADGANATRLVHRYADSGGSGGAAAFNLAAPPLASSSRPLFAVIPGLPVITGHPDIL
jgi:hypothetical protein